MFNIGFKVNIINFLQWLAYKIKECLTWLLCVFFKGYSFKHYSVQMSVNCHKSAYDYLLEDESNYPPIQN